MKKFKKAFLIGATATVLGVTSMLPFADAVNRPLVSEASTLATSYPEELKLEKVNETDKYGIEREQYKINLGKKTGTLVIKAFITDKEMKSYADTLFADVKRNRAARYVLMDDPTMTDRNAKGLIAFDRYSPLFLQKPHLAPKYKSGFQDGLVNGRGERFIALGVYVDKVYNNGVFYLDYPSLGKGLWKVKAYFYEGVNVEKQLFDVREQYFPLLRKVWWDGVELKVGQIGRLTVLEDTPLFKLEGDKKVYVRTLKKGEFYRIYAFKPGMLSVGGGLYVDRDEKVKYETPSKYKLSLTQMRLD
jgi:hypothetical protein